MFLGARAWGKRGGKAGGDCGVESEYPAALGVRTSSPGAGVVVVTLSLRFGGGGGVVIACCCKLEGTGVVRVRKFYFSHQAFPRPHFPSLPSLQVSSLLISADLWWISADLLHI